MHFGTNNAGMNTGGQVLCGRLGSVLLGVQLGVKCPISPTTLSNTFSCVFIVAIVGGMKWCLIVVLICLICAYWPFADFLWRNAYSNTLPTLKLGCPFILEL